MGHRCFLPCWCNLLQVLHSVVVIMENTLPKMYQKKKLAVIDLCNWTNELSTDSKLLPLTQGKTAAVDAILYPYLCQFNWHISNGMILRQDSKSAKCYLLNRVIWERCNGDIPKNMCVVHISDDVFDNRISNLKLATYSEIALSEGRSTKCGYKGVYKSLKDKNYFVRLKGKFIGTYSKSIEAAKVWDKCAREIGIPEEVLNFPGEEFTICCNKVTHNKVYNAETVEYCNTFNKENILFKRIPLNGNHTTLVDTALYEYLIGTRWEYYGGRVFGKVDGKTVSMTRFIYTKIKKEVPSNKKLCHINGAPLDNRLSNLNIGSKYTIQSKEVKEDNLLWCYSLLPALCSSFPP